MAFLKPLIDSPTSVPRFFSFLVPNTSTTTTRMTIQCFQSKMPMLLLLSNSYSGGRARGFLGVSGETETTVQFIEYSLWMLPQLGEHDHAVEPQIGGFVDHIAAVAADGGVLGGNDGLDRLFADFFQNLVQALVVQAGDIRAVGGGAFALFQHGGQTGQSVTHVCVLRNRWRADLSGPGRRLSSRRSRRRDRSSSGGRYGKRCLRSARPSE